MIPYDPGRDALLRPFVRDTVLKSGGIYSDLQIGAEAARLAYYPESEPTHAQRLRAALQCIGFAEPTWFVDHATDSQAFGTHRAADNTVLLAFRGTEPDKVGDIGTDIDFWKVAWTRTPGLVHAGFASGANALLTPGCGLQGFLDEHSDARLVLAGHSLGAALATLVASVHRPHTLVLMGSPRVGDAAFNVSVQADVIHRLVNCCDIITRLPPVEMGFAEVGAPSYIDAQGVVHTDWPRGDSRINADRFAAQLAYLREHAWRAQNVLVRDLSDHSPINYIRAVF